MIEDIIASDSTLIVDSPMLVDALKTLDKYNINLSQKILNARHKTRSTKLKLNNEIEKNYNSNMLLIKQQNDTINKNINFINKLDNIQTICQHTNEAMWAHENINHILTEVISIKDYVIKGLEELKIEKFKQDEKNKDNKILINNKQYIIDEDTTDTTIELILDLTTELSTMHTRSEEEYNKIKFEFDEYKNNNSLDKVEMYKLEIINLQKKLNELNQIINEDNNKNNTNGIDNDSDINSEFEINKNYFKLKEDLIKLTKEIETKNATILEIKEKTKLFVNKMKISHMDNLKSQEEEFNIKNNEILIKLQLLTDENKAFKENRLAINSDISTTISSSSTTTTTTTTTNPWEIVFDKEANQNYYYNNITNESSWEKPLDYNSYFETQVNKNSFNINNVDFEVEYDSLQVKYNDLIVELEESQENFLQAQQVQQNKIDQLNNLLIQSKEISQIKDKELDSNKEKYKLQLDEMKQFMQQNEDRLNGIITTLKEEIKMKDDDIHIKENEIQLIDEELVIVNGELATLISNNKLINESSQSHLQELIVDKDKQINEKNDLISILNDKMNMFELDIIQSKKIMDEKLDIINNLTNKNNQLEEELSENNEIITDLEIKSSDIANINIKINNELNDLKNEITQLESAAFQDDHTNKEEIITKQNLINSLESEIATLKEFSKVTIEKNNDIELTVNIKNNKVTELENELISLKSQNQILIHEKDLRLCTITSLQLNLTELEEEIINLKSSLQLQLQEDTITSTETMSHDDDSIISDSNSNSGKELINTMKNKINQLESEIISLNVSLKGQLEETNSNKETIIEMEEDYKEIINNLKNQISKLDKELIDLKIIPLSSINLVPEVNNEVNERAQNQIVELENELSKLKLASSSAIELQIEEIYTNKITISSLQEKNIEISNELELLKSSLLTSSLVIQEQKDEENKNKVETEINNIMNKVDKEVETNIGVVIDKINEDWKVKYNKLLNENDDLKRKLNEIKIEFTVNLDKTLKYEKDIKDLNLLFQNSKETYKNNLNSKEDEIIKIKEKLSKNAINKIDLTPDNYVVSDIGFKSISDIDNNSDNNNYDRSYISNNSNGTLGSVTCTAVPIDGNGSLTATDAVVTSLMFNKYINNNNNQSYNQNYQNYNQKDDSIYDSVCDEKLKKQRIEYEEMLKVMKFDSIKLYNRMVREKEVLYDKIKANKVEIKLDKELIESKSDDVVASHMELEMIKSSCDFFKEQHKIIKKSNIQLRKEIAKLKSNPGDINCNLSDDYVILQEKFDDLNIALNQMNELSSKNKKNLEEEIKTIKEEQYTNSIGFKNCQEQLELSIKNVKLKDNEIVEYKRKLEISETLLQELKIQINDLKKMLKKSDNTVDKRVDEVKDDLNIFKNKLLIKEIECKKLLDDLKTLNKDKNNENYINIMNKYEEQVNESNVEISDVIDNNLSANLLINDIDANSPLINNDIDTSNEIIELSTSTSTSLIIDTNDYKIIEYDQPNKELQQLMSPIQQLSPKVLSNSNSFNSPNSPKSPISTMSPTIVQNSSIKSQFSPSKLNSKNPENVITKISNYSAISSSSNILKVSKKSNVNIKKLNNTLSPVVTVSMRELIREVNKLPQEKLLKSNINDIISKFHK